MAILSSIYNVESNIQTTPYVTVSPTVTSGIIINTVLTITKGVLSFETNGVLEYISFGSTIVLGGRTTLVDVVRNLTTTLNDFSQISATGIQHVPGVTIVRLVNYHALYNLRAGVNISNTFTANQQIASTNKLFFFDTDTYIYDDGTDLKFKSSAQAEIALTDLANLSGVNDKTKISAADTTSGYLSAKHATPTGSGLAQTIGSPAGNEVLNVAVNLEASNPSLQVNGSNELGVKIDPNGGLSKGSGGLGVSSSATGVAGTTITTGQALSFNGNTRLVLADADDTTLNPEWLFAGIAVGGATSGNALPYVANGLATVPAFTLAQRQNCRLWTGEANASSNTTSDTISSIVDWRMQTFIPQVGQDNVSRIFLNVTNSALSATAVVRIYATTGAAPNLVPTGAALATSSNVTSFASGDLQFDFATPFSLTPGTAYAIVFNLTAYTSGSVAWNYQNSDVYANGNSGTSINSGVAWTAQPTFDRRFTVQYRGISGEPVFLSTTAGALELTPPTGASQYVVPVGYAVDSTHIFVQQGQKSIFATYNYTVTASGTVDTTLTIGFRPMLVIANLAVIEISGNEAYSMGVWFNTQSSTGFSLENKGSFTSLNAVAQFFGAGSQGLLSHDGLTSAGTPANRAKQVLSVLSSSANSITIRRVITATGTPNDATTINLLILGY